MIGLETGLNYSFLLVHQKSE